MPYNNSTYSVLLLLIVCAVYTINCSLQVKIEHVKRAQLKFIVTNTGSDSVKILTWGTPLEKKIWNNMFVVTDSAGNKLEYIGPLAKRLAPPPHAYTVIKSGSEVSATINIAKAYHFKARGKYQVKLNTIISAMMNSATVVDDNVFVIVDKHIILGVKAHFSQFAANKYKNCSTFNKGAISGAIPGTIQVTYNSYMCMANRTCGDITTTWFGQYNYVRHNYDTDVYSKVNVRIGNYGINAYCNPPGCEPNVYAYVFPIDPFWTVHFCSVFWQLPNERVNTIVHEFSHFNAVGGTQDYAYGEASCMALARSDPEKATHNADNVAYFADRAPSAQ